MKTIKERADEYIGHSLNIDEPSHISAQRSAFIDGAESEHEELTRWYDPEKKLPEPMKHVLVKYDRGYYALDFYDPRLGSFYAGSFSSDKIIGWREIYEYY